MITTQQVRRPLVGIALSMAAGSCVPHFIDISPLLMLGISALLLAAACRAVFCRGLLIYIACGLLAAAHLSMKEMPSLSRAILSSAETDSREQELTGIIKDEPSISGADGTAAFLFQVQTVRLNGQPVPADAVVKIYLKDSSLPVQFGETWRLRGRYTGYEQPRGGAVGFLSVPTNSAARLHSAGFSLLRSCYTARHRAAEILGSGINAFPDQIKLLHALLLGYRQAMPTELYRLFSRTGVLHIFAISGLHVGVMAAILIAALKITGISRPRWGWLLIPILFLYVLATGMKPSALRAFTMAAVYFAAPLAGRRPDAPSAVALAAILLLALNPANIRDPGFLLSFIVVSGIIMVHSWGVQQVNGFRFTGWEAPLKRLNGPHPMAALFRAAGLLLVTSFAAWIFSAPVTAHFFNTLSPAALVGNLAVIPLTFMVMLTGSLALLSGALFFPAAALFNLANVQFVSLLIWIVRCLSALPGAGLTVRSPSAAVTALWYTGLVFLFTGPVRWRKGAVLPVLLSGLLWSTDRLQPCRDIKLLREGESALALQLPENNRWMLITDGSSFSAARTVRLLQKEGVSQLHTLVINGERFDAEAIRWIQETFHPQQILYEENASWPAGAGVIRISRDH